MIRPRRPQRRRSAIPCRIAVLRAIMLTFVLAAANRDAVAGPFRDLLIDAGIESADIADVATLADSEQPEDVNQAAVAAGQLLWRLSQLDDVNAAKHLQQRDAASQAQPGDLVRITGRATDLRDLPAADPFAAELTATGLPEDALPQLVRHVVTVQTTNGPVALLVNRTPRAWRDRKLSPERSEPVAATAVLLRSADEQGQGVALASGVEWFPEAQAPAGWLWLARNGFDVASLDAVRHNAAFANAQSDEAAAFRACLRAVAGADANELDQLAADELRQAANADDEAIAERLVLRAGKPPSRSLDDQTQQIVDAVRRQAADRISSVAPMFLRPQATAGRLVRVEGVVRRAVKVMTPSLDGDSRVSHYELDLYTPDSQNLPVVCCVTRLPDGFPLGDAVREPVRVAGAFFKLWTFQGRPDEDGVAERTRGPIVVAPTAVRLQPTVEDEQQRSRTALTAGVAFLVALGGLWILLVRSHRRDRVVRRP